MSGFIKKFQQKMAFLWRMILETPHNKAIFILSLLSGACSYFGIPMLIPILQYLQNGTLDIGDNQVLTSLGIILNFIGIAPNFYSLLIVAALLIITSEVIVSFSSLLALYASFDLICRYSKKIFESYLKVDWLWLTGTNSGEINYVILREAEMAATCHLYAQRVVIAAVQCLAYGYIALLMSPGTVFVAVIVYSLLMIANLKNAHKIRAVTTENNELFKSMSNLLSGMQQNKKFLKTSLLNNSIVEKTFNGLNDIYTNYRHVGLRMQLQQGWNFVVVFLFLLSLIFFSKHLGLSYSALLVLFLVFNRLGPQFNTLAHSYSTLNNYLPMHQSITKRLSEMKDHEEVSGGEMYKENCDIRFEDVSFSYPNGPKVLEGLNLTIEHNKSIAIIGGSGAGKTTVLDMILGLLRPTSGKILYGQISHDQIDFRTLRIKVAYISQDPTLIDGTLRDNLTIGNPSATESEVWAICQKVHIDKFIKQLPLGLDARVGENGIQLSGGQRQRIVIGRSLFLNPKILILDEATSELDSESEAMIQQTIRELSKTLTIVIVAHRLSTVRFADKVCVLDAGKICESGTYDELLSKKGKLFYFNTLQ